jgi:hypothetical protein
MYRACIVVAPDVGLAVVVMMASNDITSDMLVKVCERVMLRALVERGILGEMPAPLPRTSLSVIAPTAAEKSAFSGFHAASDVLYRLSFAADDSMNVERYQSGGWTPAYQGFRKRSDGWYAADGDAVKALRLLAASGRSYIELRNSAGAGHYATTHLMAQRLDARADFSTAWQARLADMWLPVNNDFLAGLLDLDNDPRLPLTAADGPTGYLLAGMKILREMNPQSDDRLDGMYLQIPQTQGRDLVDAAIERRSGADWLRLGSALYRPQSGVPLIAAGASSVTIGGEGFAEWRKLPFSGAISIVNAGSWRLYNSNFDQTASGRGDGSALLPGSGDAAYLMLFGAPGATIHLNLVP